MLFVSLQSTKKRLVVKDNDGEKEFIGEKGIGFKSVFLISKQPHIFSNGYYFHLDRDPEPTEDNHNVEYPVPLPLVVPTWIGDTPKVAKAYEFAAKIEEVSNVISKNRGTILILPLDSSDTFNLLHDMLRRINSELILFLSKIDSLGLYFPTGKRVLSRSRQHLEHAEAMLSASLCTTLTTAQTTETTELKSEEMKWYCCKFRVGMSTVHEEKRPGVNSVVMTLALPLNTATRTKVLSHGVLYAYLPTMKHLRLPFLINSDFILVPSRDQIDEDNLWNKRLLGRVCEVFCTAFEDAITSKHQSLRSQMIELWKLLTCIAKVVEVTAFVRLTLFL